MFFPYEEEDQVWQEVYHLGYIYPLKLTNYLAHLLSTNHNTRQTWCPLGSPLSILNGMYCTNSGHATDSLMARSLFMGTPFVDLQWGTFQHQTCGVTGQIIKHACQVTHWIPKSNLIINSFVFPHNFWWVFFWDLYLESTFLILFVDTLIHFSSMLSSWTTCRIMIRNNWTLLLVVLCLLESVT